MFFILFKIFKPRKMIKNKVEHTFILGLEASICSSSPLNGISEFDHFAMGFAVIKAL